MLVDWREIITSILLINIGGIDLVENDKGYAPVFIFLSYIPNGFDRVVIIVK